jgi:hypothetical protein
MEKTLNRQLRATLDEAAHELDKIKNNEELKSEKFLRVSKIKSENVF